MPVEISYAADDFRRGILALDKRGIKNQLTEREAPCGDVFHILNRGSGRRGHNADTKRRFRKSFLVRRVEKPFGGKLCFEFFKRFVQAADAVLFYCGGVKLI